MSVDEPAVDLAVVAAVASSVRNRPIAPGTAVFGEVGLAGEVRATAQAARRVREAAQMGFTRCVMPAANVDPTDPGLAGTAVRRWSGVRGRVQEALEHLLALIPAATPCIVQSYTEAAWPGSYSSGSCSSSASSYTATAVPAPAVAVVAGQRGASAPRWRAVGIVARVAAGATSACRTCSARSLGAALGLLFARPGRPALCWSTADPRVDLPPPRDRPAVPVHRARHRRPARRMARAVAADHAVPGGRPAAALQDPRHQRHHRRPHRRHLRDRLPRRHAGRARSSC